MDGSILLSVSMVMLGCCSNAITLESVFFRCTSCGSLVTLSQFAILAVYGLVLNLELKNGIGLKTRKSPLYWHLFQVILFFGSSLLNNLAFAYHISMPLHSLIRSGSLAMNIVVGYVIFRYKTTLWKAFCVLIVSIGIFLASIASSQSKEKVFNQEMVFSEWIIGIAMLFVALILQALLGNAQQYSFQTWKSDPQETVFYSHMLSIPFFAFYVNDLIPSWEKFNTSAPYSAFVPIPELWVINLINVATQIVCVVGVHRLTSQTSSLTNTLAITIRKFISLLISLVLFDNKFSTLHWIGTSLVFAGSIWFWRIEVAEKKKVE
jgi:UDP-xylose/UDP-N-acetylglucosamine transporter B4